MWEVNVTDDFRFWFTSLSAKERKAVVAAVEELASVGPTLGRPRVDRIKMSVNHNMKELRPAGVGKFLRVLFVFDPIRQIVLLIGGNKEGDWSRWYRMAIPRADFLYEVYLDDIRAEGLMND